MSKRKPRKQKKPVKKTRPKLAKSVRRWTGKKKQPKTRAKRIQEKDTQEGLKKYKVEFFGPKRRKQWSANKYESVAKTLKMFGVVFPRDRKWKGKIKKTFVEMSPYIYYCEPPNTSKRKAHGIEYNFMFVKLTKEQRKNSEKLGLYSSKQYTPTGVFVEKPANLSAKQYKVKFLKSGHVEFSGKKRKDVLVRIDAKKLAVDPHKAFKSAITELKKRPKTVSLMVNGFQAGGLGPTKPSDFYTYMDGLFDSFAERNQKYYDDEEDMTEGFADIFHMKASY